METVKELRAAIRVHGWGYVSDYMQRNRYRLDALRGMQVAACLNADIALELTLKYVKKGVVSGMHRSKARIGDMNIFELFYNEGLNASIFYALTNRNTLDVVAYVGLKNTMREANGDYIIVEKMYTCKKYRGHGYMTTLLQEIKKRESAIVLEYKKHGLVQHDYISSMLECERRRVIEMIRRSGLRVDPKTVALEDIAYYDPNADDWFLKSTVAADPHEAAA